MKLARDRTIKLFPWRLGSSVTVVMVSITLGSTAFAEPKPTPTPEITPPPGPATKLADSITGTLVEQATALDIMLAGKKYTRTRNESKAEIKQHVSWRDWGGGLSNSTDFNLDLRLPNLEKRWALRFSSYDEAEEERDISRGQVRRTPREKRPGAALVVARQLGNVQTVFQPRLLLKDPLVLNYVVRFQSHAKFGPWKVHPQLQLFADAEKGTGQFGALEFRYDFSTKMGTSLRLEEEYSDFENKFTTSYSLNLGRALSETMGVGLNWSANSSNQPAFGLLGYTVGVVFSHVLRTRRLDYSVSPFVDFSRVTGFRGIFGVSSEFTLTF